MAKSVVGIDIGSAALRAVEVSDPGKAKPTVLRYFEVPLADGAVSSGEVIEPNTVAAALKQLWAKGGFKTKNVVLGLGNQRVLARDLSVPKASIKVIRESLPFQVQDLLPVPVSDALLDFYPISEQMGEDGPIVNGLLIAAVKDAVLGNVKAAQLAGLMTVDVDLIPFALSRALLRRTAGDGLNVLIDVGANTTSVVIAKDGVPQFVRLIPAGGNDLTKALAVQLEMVPSEAENLKRRLGLASRAQVPEDLREGLQIIYEVTSELLGSLRNTVNYFVNTRPHESVRRLIISGGGANLPGFVDALREMTRLEVVAADPLHSVALARNVNPEHFRMTGSAMNVALGLALGNAA